MSEIDLGTRRFKIINKEKNNFQKFNFI